MMLRRKSMRDCACLGLLLLTGTTVAYDVHHSELHNLRVDVLSDGLSNPWGMVFLPDGRLLITERPGRLRVFAGGRLLTEGIGGLPDVHEQGQGGLLGIAIDPAFEHNSRVYLAYTGRGQGGYGTEVASGRLHAMRLEDVEIIFAALPKSAGGRHFGSRLVFGADGTLYISLGERGERSSAQALLDHRGSLIRINADGSVPADNPFAGHANARAEIFAYGNRNMQGMAVHPQTGEIWTHEHGPQGGDELNIMHAGANYGWPIITYGVNYGSGTKIGEGTRKAGMEQPLYKWIPSIAPSGMTFYTGNEFVHWQGDLFVGSLKFSMLVRLRLDGNRVVDEERLLTGAYGRIRDVVQGPDGLLYLLTDDSNGKLLRLGPDD